MGELQELGRRIGEELSAAEERRRAQDDAHRRCIVEFQQRHERYTVIAAHVLQSIMLPHMHKIAEYFEHAQVSDCENSDKDRCVLHLRASTRFPAAGTLELAVSRDAECETLFILSTPEIMPVFCSFEDRQRLTVPLDRVTDDTVAAWVAERLVRFVRAYLCSEAADQYDTKNMATDPVCGTRINRLYAAAQSEFDDSPYYFCGEHCLKKFVENPRQYLAGVDVPVMSLRPASTASES